MILYIVAKTAGPTLARWWRDDVDDLEPLGRTGAGGDAGEGGRLDAELA